MAVRWSCVEAGCDWSVEAAEADAIVPLVQTHIAEAHSSFELEDMIEAVLEDVPDRDEDGERG
jgi:predicted small metal-binding protein